MRRLTMTTTACLLILCTGVSGCATTGDAAAPGRTAAAADTCQALRKPFDRARTYVRDQAVAGAVTGALLGALTGAITGDGKGKNIARGAVAGAVTGGVLAYVAAKKQSARDASELQSLIDNDFAAEMGVYSVMAGNLAALGDCRRGQLHALREDLEAGRVDKAQGRVRLDALERAIAQDDVVISAAAQVQSRRVIYYAQAQGVAEGLQETQLSSEAEVVRYLGGDAEVDRYRAQVTLVGGDDETDAARPGAMAPIADSAESAAATRTAYAKASGARVRTQPSTSAAEVTFLAPGTAVQVVGPAKADAAWSEVRHDGKTGFIRSDLLGASRPAKAAAAAPRQAAVANAGTPAPARPARPKGPRLIKVSMPMVAATRPKDRTRQAVAAGRSFADVKKASDAATARSVAYLNGLV
jgi:outer membrane lipoprotein SlyB